MHGKMPQRGLEINEEDSKACLREIREETGIAEDQLKLLENYPEAPAYELQPDLRNRKTGRSQVQY